MWRIYSPYLHHLGWCWNPVNNGIFTISTAAGFLPVSACAGFCPWTISWNHEIFDNSLIHSYLFTWLGVERSILTLSGDVHSNSNQQIIDTWNFRKKKKKQKNMYPTSKRFFFHCDDWDLWENLNCYQMHQSATLPAGAAPSASTKEREADRVGSTANRVGSHGWEMVLFLCFGWEKNKSIMLELGLPLWLFTSA